MIAPLMWITPLAIILFVSAVIAIIAPFDVMFTAATFGSPVLRAILIAVLVLAGAWAANSAGLRLLTGQIGSVLIGAIAAVLVAGYVVAIDCYLFRSSLPASYVQFFEQTPLAARLAYFMLRAFNENVIYRLFVFSMALCLLLMARPQGLAPTVILAVMVATQALNIGLNVTALSPDPITPATLSYEALRYIVPGVIWAWLFWRFGFMAAEVASVGCHIFLQPALGMLL
ncbi:hypothetical protein FKO01_36085 [Mesorhizobium sp. B2-3-3]|uniref:hypothetical protein n=1 Tax=Mesorhizobium sp. B2-4-15 TaxID=2589934 RepID=UPI0011520378|nr:hypothetical protein [Mesorhizobium sp. B2-4-15]TPK77165.1 hypothetical protein FJ930_00605 [Mesorhizobium sp. B2-4-15]TPN18293.1 hypothetical protein FKO01_36085 [Mesorhizobium sp. B2-3-3]